MEYKLRIPGHKNYRARGGVFVNAETPDKARAKFRREFKKDFKLKGDEVIEVLDRDDKPVVSKDAQARVTTHDDSAFKRTAIVAGLGGGDGEKNGFTVAVVDEQGQRLCEINCTVVASAGKVIDLLIVDVIDADDRFEKHRAFTWPKKDGPAKVTEARTIVCADFRQKGVE